MPVYFIKEQNVSGGTISIGLPLAHHLVNVLRYRKGDTVTFVEEPFKKYGARVLSVSSGRVRCEIIWEKRRETTDQPLLHLGCALLKGDRTDGVVEKAVELGISRISLVVTQRVVAKPRGDRMAHQQKRWERIAQEAAQQSERWMIPRIGPPTALHSFLEETKSADLKWIFWEEEKTASIRSCLSFAPGRSPASFVLLIGPEGGWEKGEVDQAREWGYRSVSLGPRPLRADTAAIAALAIVQQMLQNGETCAN